MIEVPVVPAPLWAETRPGPPFLLRPGVRIEVAKNPTAVATAVLLATQVGREVDGPVAVGHEDGRTPGVIALRLTTAPADLPVPEHLPIALAAEAYRLEVDEHRVVITALEPPGLVRGVQTLAQLVARDPESGGAVIDPVLVVDHPRFVWRGLMLDLARHFFDLETIRTVIAVLSSLKLNVLHLHLTDDQGWRLEVPSRPELATVGGTNAVGRDPGGWLSTRDYAELVAFAAAHEVTIVPEVDLPGHVGAALRTYAALSPGGRRTRASIGLSRLHADLPATAPFIRDVLTDMAGMTKGSYLHIGGDDAPTLEPDEYRELVTVAVDAVEAAGKRVVGWQEIASVPLSPGSVVQYRDERDGPAGVVAAAGRGAQVLLSPASRAYLDMKYDDATPVGSEWAGPIELRTAYCWEPGELVGLEDRQIAGVEAAVWTETVRTPRELFVLLLPRLAAIAEVAWSASDRRRYDDFLARLDRTTSQWDAAGWPWYRAAVEPGSPIVAG